MAAKFFRIWTLPCGSDPGSADADIGVQSVASICGLDFVPLQRGRYDLVIPKVHSETLHGLSVLLDTIVSKPFKDGLMV